MKAENIEVAQKQFQEMNLPIDCADFATIMAKEKPLFALRKIFGHGSFRGGQQETIESVLQGKDTIALLPTVVGKQPSTLYYQFFWKVSQLLCNH